MYLDRDSLGVDDDVYGSIAMSWIGTAVDDLRFSLLPLEQRTDLGYSLILLRSESTHHDASSRYILDA